MSPYKYNYNRKWYVKYWGAIWEFDTEAEADAKVKELCREYITDYRYADMKDAIQKRKKEVDIL